MACCLGTFCVILVLGIIAVTVYRKYEKDQSTHVMNLTAENHSLREKSEQLEAQNKELETEKENLTEQISDIMISWNKLNISRAQWNRKCKPCQKGWDHVESSCYATNDADSNHWKTWEAARKDCRGKSSDLVIITTALQPDFCFLRYWIGLRVEGGKWKWVDGSYLTDKCNGSNVDCQH
uniref:C-type lectin domain-containing protein n=1 Tax=Oreochromis aureus TaxID=47969 RepID=A0AAZ1Y054_OREAU